MNAPNPCNNGGQCFYSQGSITCMCNEGFDGKRCEDVCSLDCGINGSCVNEIDSTTGIKKSQCLCTDNFTGLA